MPTKVSLYFIHPHRTSHCHCPADISDYWPSNSSPSSSSSSSGSGTNLGAIIGGAIGGAAALLLVLVGGYFLYKRRQGRRLNDSNGATPILHLETPRTNTNTHTRWPSDPSTIFLGSPHVTTQSQGTGPGTNVPPPTSYSSFQSSPPPPPTETTSYLTSGNTVAQRTRAIPMV